MNLSDFVISLEMSHIFLRLLNLIDDYLFKKYSRLNWT